MARPLNSIYIHIPFCQSKCHYCNFTSFTGKKSCIEDYFKALNIDTSCYLKNTLGKKFKTLYIGGGTPSLVESFLYENLLSGINLSDNAEVTIEANPGTVSAQYLKTLRKIGFNRISLGVQCFDNGTLKLLNRLHSAQEAIEAVDYAKKSGFDNISIDLIYGLPGQKLFDWEKTLYQAIDLDVNHISAYGLKIEENTEFFNNLPDELPDEDLNAQMYLRGVEILEQNGFEHYEISNFAKPGFSSAHNLAYWNNDEYLGFGVAAHGYVNGERYCNKTVLESYMENPLEKKTQRKLTADEVLEEAIFLGLRLRNGIDPDEMEKKYSVNLFDRYKHIIEKYKNLGLMDFRGSRLQLTIQGVLLSNDIFADFL